MIQNPRKNEISPHKEIIYLPANYADMEDDDEIDLLELWSIIWNGRWFVATLSAACVFIAVVLVMFILPEFYKASGTIFLTGKNEDSSSSRLQALASRLPIDIGMGQEESSSSQNVLTFLNSRDFRMDIVRKYELLPVIYKDKWNAETQTWDEDDPEEIPTYLDVKQSVYLDNMFEASIDKDSPNLITISLEAEDDPEFARLMVERIIDFLKYFLENEFESNFSRNKKFIESQLEKARQEMEHWDNQVPDKDLTLSKIKREQGISSQIYSEFRKQFEQAKITEAKEQIRFKVLDQPYLPKKPSKPNKKLICALSLISSAFMGIFLVFFRNFVINARLRMQSHEPKAA